MSKVAIMTDTNSGIEQSEAKSLDIALLPMPFIIDSKEYFEGINLTHNEFYSLLDRDLNVSTSQPTPASVIDMWDSLFESGYDEIVYIPMSSGLSKSCETAMTFAKEYDGKVFVVDNGRISVTQRQSVLDAITLKNQGKSAKDIKEILERDKDLASIYITVDTLKFLKKGGRITPTAAALGTVLNLKPVLFLRGERLDAFAKIRGMKMARTTMINAIKNDIETKFLQYAKNGKLALMASYSGGNSDTINSWIDEVKQAFPSFEVYSSPLSLSIGCHIGSGALGIAVCVIE